MNTEKLSMKREAAPAAETEKSPSRSDVWRMFDRIAHRYDLLNRLLSAGQDVRWRNKLAANLPGRSRQRVLDLATGTADVLLSLFRKSNHIEWAVGMDMAQRMLDIGREKVRERNLQHTIALLPGDAVYLPFQNDCFDAVTIAFGIRNVTDVNRSLREMQRVLRPGGRALILEFSLPANALFRRLYLFYFRHILPTIGGLISGDNYAYRYLNRTVETFPYGRAFCRLMEEAGFRQVQAIPLTFGIATIYRGEKI